MYEYYKKIRYILYAILITVSIIALLIFLIFKLKEEKIYYLLYPYVMFLVFWGIVFYYDLKLRPQSWIYKHVKVIKHDDTHEIPETISVLKMKEKTGVLPMDFIRKMDNQVVYTYPKLTKTHTRNKYIVTSIYEPWAVIKDASGKSYTIHLSQIEPYIQKKDDSK